MLPNAHRWDMRPLCHCPFQFWPLNNGEHWSHYHAHRNLKSLVQEETESHRAPAQCGPRGWEMNQDLNPARRPVRTSAYTVCRHQHNEGDQHVRHPKGVLCPLASLTRCGNRPEQEVCPWANFKGPPRGLCHRCHRTTGLQSRVLLHEGHPSLLVLCPNNTRTWFLVSRSGHVPAQSRVC